MIEWNESTGTVSWFAALPESFQAVELHASPETTRAQIVDRIARAFTTAWASDSADAMLAELALADLAAVRDAAKALLVERARRGLRWYSEGTIVSDAFAEAERRVRERGRARILQAA